MYAETIDAVRRRLADTEKVFAAVLGAWNHMSPEAPRS